METQVQKLNRRLYKGARERLHNCMEGPFDFPGITFGRGRAKGSVRTGVGADFLSWLPTYVTNYIPAHHDTHIHRIRERLKFSSLHRAELAVDELEKVKYEDRQLAVAFLQERFDLFEVSLEEGDLFEEHEQLRTAAEVYEKLKENCSTLQLLECSGASTKFRKYSEQSKLGDMVVGVYKRPPTTRIMEDLVDAFEGFVFDCYFLKSGEFSLPISHDRVYF